MPYNFSGFQVSSTAKPGVVSDGETFTTDGYGTTVTSTMSSYTAFASVPKWSATGVWSLTLKDSAAKVLDVSVNTVLASTHYLSVQQLATTSSSTTGGLILNWVFNVSGTPTDLPANGGFRVYVVYSERT